MAKTDFKSVDEYIASHPELDGDDDDWAALVKATASGKWVS